MEVMKGRRSTGTEGRSMSTTLSNPEYIKPRNKSVDMSHDHHNQHLARNRNSNLNMKMLNKVQVVYYLTRQSGQLQHPHFLEVTHLASQPLRLKDVIDRLAVLRGKAMPSQYSWSCKRSYKNGYVWNDLTENDIIYPSQGSEYVLKGSELIQAADISESRAEEPEMKAKQQVINGHLLKHKTNGWVVDTPSDVHQGHSFRQIVMDTSSVAHQGHSFRKEPTNNVEQRPSRYSAEHNEDDEDEECQDGQDYEDEKTSCSNSSNAPYPPSNISDCPLVTVQTEQEETYPLQSASMCDKQPLTPPPKEIIMATVISESEPKRLERKCVTDKREMAPSSLTRNPVLLQLIACGGGSVSSSKEKPRSNAKANVKSFNFNTMRSSIIPCLKQQLSTKKERLRDRTSMKMISNDSSTGNYMVPLHKAKEVGDSHHGKRAIDEDEEDEDMMMVKCMSENPRFGNLQSEEKEYFSGTIIESASSTSALVHTHYHSPIPVITKSSSYNELRAEKAGLQANTPPTTPAAEQVKGGANRREVIKCIPRMKSCAYTCS